MVDYITELFYDGQWNDITADVRDSAPIAINRGRKDWASVNDPATCTFTLNNGNSNVADGVLGRYSPRNPRSDLYGKIGRNTPIRVRIDGPRQNNSLRLPGVLSSHVTAPDSAGFSGITGDIDVRLDMHPDNWQTLDNKYRFLLSRADVIASPLDFSWAWYLRDTGVLNFQWSEDGGVGSGWSSVTSEASIPANAGRLVIRATLDVDDGAGDHVVTFYTGSDIDTGPWTELGDPITLSGTTSIFDSDAPVILGGSVEGVPIFGQDSPLDGEIFAARILDGIDGTVEGDPDFSGHEPEDREFEDTAGNTWTLHDSATFTDDSIRFSGEATKWPVRWPLAGGESGWVPFTASGIQRRLQRGTKPLRSSLFRDISTKPNIAAYWPLEEPEGATEFASGITSTNVRLSSRDPELIDAGADSSSFVASAPLPTIGASTILGPVPDYDGEDRQRFLYVISIPADVEWSSTKLIMRLLTTGSVARWDISQAPSDNTNINAYDEDGNEVLGSGILSPLFGLPSALSLDLEQDGPDIRWEIGRVAADGIHAGIVGGIINNETFGRFSRVFIGSTDDMESSSFGHATIFNGTTDNIWNDISQVLFAWAGETGANRLVRLSADEGLPAVRVEGPSYAVETMGPQRQVTLIELFREVPTADLGILDDRNDALGVYYRPRTTLYNQEPVLTLDYSDGIISEPFEPVDDDQSTRNSVEIRRVRGSSSTAEKTEGVLSIQAPPDGVGKYDISQEINIDDDDRTEEQAYFRLHLGTIDEARFPTVRLNLRNPRVALLESAILAVRLGDIIEITNPPEWLPAGPYLLFVEAIDEEKTAETHFVTFTCSPGSAWEVLTLDDEEHSRLDTAGSELAASIDDTDTELLVATQSGSQIWIQTSKGLLLDGESGNYASTSDDPSLDISGDIDIRVDAALDLWTGFGAELVSKYDHTTDNASYSLGEGGGGGAQAQFQFSLDGDTSTSATEPLPVDDGDRIAVRVTREAATGDVRFYTAPSGVDGPWTPLGGTHSGPSGSLFSGNAPLEIGARAGQFLFAEGVIFAAQVRDGIDGTIVANPDFNEQPSGTTSFTDSAGKPWTIHGTAEIGSTDAFFIKVGGEVMLVEQIEGDLSPQTFHVVRSGVLRQTTPAGSEVELAHPVVISL